MYKKFLKRFFDLILSLVILICISPLFIVIIIVLLIVNKGNVFFFQIRPGKDAKEFRIIKFKTMNDRKDQDENLLPDNLRLTKVGKFIRSISIDELPQLLNIFIGDMSFVGPRPLLPKYIPLYSKEQARRHDVRPGLTGWTQVNGRNNIPWEKKFELDIWYVDNYSFWIDLKTLWLTFNKVIKKEGVSKDGHLTTDGFNGRN